MIIVYDGLLSFVLGTTHMISFDNWTFIQNTSDDDDNGGRLDEYKEKKEISPCKGIYTVSL